MFETDPGVRKLLDTFHRAGLEAWVVGGAVRDCLLGRPVSDLDVTTNATPEQVQSLFPGSKRTGKDCGTVQVALWANRFEVTPYRLEAGYGDHRHPDRVVWAKTLEEDLARRDFTVNAMAFDGAVLKDPFGGQKDLAAKTLRCVGEPAERFGQDALRILRLFRFAARLDFDVEPATLSAALSAADTLQKLPAQRVRSEVQATLLAAGVARAAPLFASGALAPFGLPALTEDAAPLSVVPGVMLLRWWALASLCGADELTLCQTMGFSGAFYTDLTRLNEAFCALCADGAGLRRLLKAGLPEEPEQVFTAFCALDADWGRVWPLWDEQQKYQNAYTVGQLAVRPATLMALGLTGERLGRVQKQLLDLVIETPALNKAAALTALAEQLARL